MANYIEARLAQFRADAEKQIQFHANCRLSMTDQQRPITPPPELVQEWTQPSGYKVLPGWLKEILQKAAQWGADQELEACVEWLPSDLTIDGESLRDVRRPKPPSLAEEALEALEEEDDSMPLMSLQRSDRFELIRRALERLQKLEGGND
jgi:hypothetical protein